MNKLDQLNPQDFYYIHLQKYLQFACKCLVCIVKFECLNEFLVYIFFFTLFLFNNLGPFLPLPLLDHSMVRLGKGQAILGGYSNGNYQAMIYSMTCSNRNCIISLLDRELSDPKSDFVAIPIPDTISGCITGGKKYFQKKTQNI